MTTRHWMSRINETTGQPYTEEEADFRVKSQRKTNPEYWLSRGHSKEFALEQVSKFQSEMGLLFSKKNSSNPSKYRARTWTQIEYWIHRGFSESEAIYIISNKQNIGSLESFIGRYGSVLGPMKHKEFCEKMSHSQSLAGFIDRYGPSDGPMQYQRSVAARVTSLPRVSRESILYFAPLYSRLRKSGVDRSDIFWGTVWSSEYYLSGPDVFFKYDFTVLSRKKIIEYHGEAFHPNPNWESSRLSKWRMPFDQNMTWQEKVKIDSIKENFARSRGYKVLCVWSDNLPTHDELFNYIIN